MPEGWTVAAVEARDSVLPINTHFVVRCIDTTDIPEVLGWSHARRADLYRPVKQQITLRLDAGSWPGSRNGLPEAAAIRPISTVR